MMTAEQIALALGATRSRQSPRGRTWRVLCVSHGDRTPSLDITETADGGALVICRAGCSQTEVIAALAQRGLWGANRAIEPARRFNWRDHLGQPMPPTIPPCCLETACPHWRQFEAEYLIAHLLGNLRDAIAEITSRQPHIDAVALKAEIQAAVPHGAIVPSGIPADVANQIIIEAVEQWNRQQAA